MKCKKCGGLMVLQSFFDHFINFEGWKCLNCGKIMVKKDKTIESDSFSIFYQQNKCKTVLNMLYFLNFQATYNSIEYSLWNNDICIEAASIDKMEASKSLIIKLDSLLKQHSCALESIQFIAANKGPGPFTTLRVLIATLNGLSFAKKIPLIGIDGLDAFAYEYKSSNHEITIILLNAYNNDVYFGIYNTTEVLYKGSCSIAPFLSYVQEKYKIDTIQWLGNGVLLHKEAILSLYSKQAYIPKQLPEFCSLKIIALLGREKWLQKHDLTNMLLPLYLKQAINKTYLLGV